MLKCGETLIGCPLERRSDLPDVTEHSSGVVAFGKQYISGKFLCSIETVVVVDHLVRIESPRVYFFYLKINCV